MNDLDGERKDSLSAIVSRTENLLGKDSRISKMMQCMIF
jgi:hypothetical protein